MAVDWDNLVVGPTTAYFGLVATYQPQAAAAFPVNGVFDEAYKELRPIGSGEGQFSDMLLGSVVTTEMPVLGVQLSQFPQPPQQGDTLVIGLVRYAVREVRPDSHGAAKLMLNQVAAQPC